MKSIKYIAFFIVFVIQSSCFSQNIFSKIWHNSTSHYNYYYNAQQLIIEVYENSRSSYKDNFKEIISIFPIPSEAELKGNSAKMDEVLKKCSHIIEKHAKGKWVDDSYLLMGNANFFKGDVYTAMEVYEYIAGTFKGSVAAYKAELNLLVCYIQLKKIHDAEAFYNKLKNNKKFPKSLETELNIAGASTQILNGKYKNAIKLLETAIPKVKGKDKKIRYNFVLAQLYQLNNQRQEALLAYKKVVKLNPPYEFAFQAKLNMAKAINPKSMSEVNNAIASLKEMLRDDKNIDLFDQIYFELGKLYLLKKDEQEAINYFSQSIRAKSSDINLRSTAYLSLAELYFKNQKYELAQVYYDSAARSVDPSHPDYQSILSTNLILNDLIKHLVTVRTNDSLLNLAENEKLREKTIDRLIQEEKELAEKQKQEEEQRKLQQQFIADNNIQGAVQTTFPFYNQAARTKGFQDFQRIWGNRTYADFWAISSNKTVLWEKIDKEQKTADYGSETKNKLIENAPQERKKYYENIPFTNDDKQKLKDESAASYFFASNIYYQNLKESDKARKLLEAGLTKYPNHKYAQNSYFLLAKIYKEQGNQAKYEYYLQLLRGMDSTSQFLKVLENKTDSTAKKNITVDEAEILYTKAYKAYKEKNYDLFYSLKKENDTKFPGNALQANYDYLEVLILAEQKDNKILSEKLQKIIEGYPNTPIAERCKLTLKKLTELTDTSKSEQTNNNTTKSNSYQLDKTAPHLAIIILPTSSNIETAKRAMHNYNKSSFPTDNLQVNNTFVGNKQILMITQFENIEKGENYLKLLNAHIDILKELQIEKLESYLITTSNLSLLIKSKNLDEYSNFYQTNYNK